MGTAGTRLLLHQVIGIGEGAVEAFVCQEPFRFTSPRNDVATGSCAKRQIEKSSAASGAARDTNLLLFTDSPLRNVRSMMPTGYCVS